MSRRRRRSTRRSSTLDARRDDRRLVETQILHPFAPLRTPSTAPVQYPFHARRSTPFEPLRTLSYPFAPARSTRRSSTLDARRDDRRLVETQFLHPFAPLRTPSTAIVQCPFHARRSTPSAPLRTLSHPFLTHTLFIFVLKSYLSELSPCHTLFIFVLKSYLSELSSG